MVWPITVYWSSGGRPRDDLAARTEAEAEELAAYINDTWNDVLAVHVEGPTEAAEGRYEILTAPRRRAPHNAGSDGQSPAGAGAGTGGQERSKDRTRITIDTSDCLKVGTAAIKAGVSVDVWLSQAIAEKLERQQDPPQKPKWGALSGGWFDKMGSIAGDD